MIFAALLIALAGLLLVASRISHAGRLAAALHDLPFRVVQVQVWGTPLTLGHDTGFRVETVRAFGAAVLIWLRPLSEGRPILLKIAQPRPALMQGQTIEIRQARYVQWNNRQLPPVADSPAVKIEVRPEQPG